MVKERYNLDKFRYGRFLKRDGEVTCYAEGCGKELHIGDPVVSKGAASSTQGNIKMKLYCMECAERLVL